MQLKRYVAATMSQALATIRQELGDDAAIWSSRNVADGVEVIAARDEASGDAMPAMPPAETEAAPIAQRSAEDAAMIKTMQTEIQSLRTLLEDQLADLVWEQHQRRTPIQAALLRRLKAMAIQDEVAQTLVRHLDTTESIDAGHSNVREAMQAALRICDQALLQRGGVVALIGATGVGKTTTIAKLAAHYAMTHGADQVALITTDAYRIAAQEQLKTYAQILQVPFRVAHDAKALREALKKFEKHAFVLIDTAGMGQDDERLAEHMQLLKQGAPQATCYWVMAATAQHAVLEHEWRMFHSLQPKGCIVTKLDEALQLGEALSVILAKRIAVAYLGTGQHVPHDLQVADAAAIIALLEERIAVDQDQAVMTTTK